LASGFGFSSLISNPPPSPMFWPSLASTGTMPVKAWQHPCGSYRERATFDPRKKYSDFYELIHKGVSKSATAKLDLLARVAEHKSLFFKSSWAKYGESAKGTLRITPPDHRIKALRENYAKMQQMYFGEPPDIGKIMEDLKQWESECNQA